MGTSTLLLMMRGPVSNKIRNPAPPSTDGCLCDRMPQSMLERRFRNKLTVGYWCVYGLFGLIYGLKMLILACCERFCLCWSSEQFYFYVLYYVCVQIKSSEVLDRVKSYTKSAKGAIFHQSKVNSKKNVAGTNLSVTFVLRSRPVVIFFLRNCDNCHQDKCCMGKCLR